MNKITIVLLICIAVISAGIWGLYKSGEPLKVTADNKVQQNYWFVLHRKSNTEEMFYGIAGSRENSKIVRNFVVKTGIPGKRPTPLPKLVGREFWKIIKKESSAENPETAPYFLTLDIPAPSVPPYGPIPYEECNGESSTGVQDKPASTPLEMLNSRKDEKRGEQCNWILPGAFGLHGVNGDMSRLSDENIGSSGCIRHSDEDIIYLYNLLEPSNDEIRYYVEDN